MQSFFFRALWLSSVVSAQQVITITEYRKCSTSAIFSAPTYNSTQSPSQPADPISSTQSSSQPADPISSSVSSSAAPSGVTGGANPVLGSTGPGQAAQVGALSPTAQQNVDNLFWLNYGRAIMQAAKFQPGGTNAFFIGSTTQKGPPAGDNIPEGYTNLGLHAIANNLLNDSNPFYEPSGLYGYAEALQE